ncbi:MAG: hybrid sensor histidine kinase/response regulator [Thermomonas haemolytica]
MQASPSVPPRLYRASLLRQWTLRVVVPLALATVIAFALLAYAAWPEGAPPLALWRGGLLLLAALAWVVALSWGIAVRVAKPLAELTEAVERLGRGERVQLHPLPQGGAIARLQAGINQASQALASARNRMQSELGRTSIELADKHAKLEAASRARSRLLAAASHDLRQPLYALTLFSSTLRAGETDPARLERIQHIEECVASLDQLFSELLDLSRLEAGSMRAQPVAVRLDEVFDEASRNFRMLAESRGLRLVLRKTGAWVHCDRSMLARILNNLISNALRYTDSGGVLVGVRHQTSGQVRIDVWDTGCGIAAEHQQRVFEEFYQVRTPAGRTGEGARGLGLGLATVRRLVDLVGGRIALASRPGKGTRIALWLDACTPAQRTPPPALDAPLDISGLRVLAIDDEPGILQGLRTLLAEWGCDVRAAASPAEALEQLRGWFGPPDLVISDLHLGDGPDGLETLRAIARQLGEDPRRPGFARLLVTGETRRDRVDAIATHQIPVLFKPVPPQRLREAMLAAVLAARAHRDTHSTENA